MTHPLNLYILAKLTWMSFMVLDGERWWTNTQIPLGGTKSFSLFCLHLNWSFYLFYHHHHIAIIIISTITPLPCLINNWGNIVVIVIHFPFSPLISLHRRIRVRRAMDIYCHPCRTKLYWIWNVSSTLTLILYFTEKNDFCFL